MAPIKFEENIREKLQERELQPSEGAWNKLEARLGESSENKKPSYFWMAIAASFVGMLLVGSWFFFSEDESNTQIVNEDSIETKKEDTPFEEITNEIIPLQKEDQRTASEAMDKVEVSESKKTAPIVKAPITNPRENAMVVQNTTKERESIELKKEVMESMEEATDKGIAAQQDIIKEESLDATTVAKLDEETYIQQKVDEVINEVKKIQKEKSSVSIAEVDALLAKAQRDIATKRILNSAHQKVDAQALLMDVEYELERSFRDRVFQALGDGFDKVRTAVAERNN